MKRPAHLAFLLHMHQPLYVDPISGRAELPWVRLHGARGYLDVATLLDEHERVKLTVNFVPSLVAQLEGVAAGAADAWLAIAEKPARELIPDERRFIVERFFSLNWSRSVETRPRYRELLDKRGRQVRPEELRQRAAAFGDEDLRDLTVLFNLSWIGFAARAGDRELASLEKRGRDFTDEDLHLVHERQRAACGRVLPLYRKLAARGQVELSSSPFFHPILPLVVDSDSARRAMPDAKLPSRFAFGDDALAQIERGKAEHARVFGAQPVGMWPPEGSVSPEAVALYHRAGVRWLATDEGNLWRSLGAQHRGDLYRAHRFGGVDLVFRDRELSDKVGFSYAHGDAEAGARDLIERACACAAISTAPPGDPPLVPVILDGENPWEAYPGSGEPFLRTLFSELAASSTLAPVSIGEHLQIASNRHELPSLHSGSWIDSDFHIWIGDPVKNRAWELLGHARHRVEAAPSERRAAALDHLFAAEGSDWFWWFGEPFHSAEDALFDRLFRSHLEGVYRALGEPVPPRLHEPVDGSVATGGTQAPYAFIHPTIAATGKPASYYAWRGAGRYEVPRGAAMADHPLVETIHFGFDLDHLYLRLDPSATAGALDGVTLEVDVAHAPGDGAARQLRVTAAASGWQLDEGLEGAWRELARGGSVAFHARIELSVPFARLGARAGDRLALWFRLRRGEVALARYPVDGTLPLTVPDASFESENWSA